MNFDSQAAIIVNDLDSMIHRLEGLPAHPRYTDALVKVMDAKDAMIAGRNDIHQKDMDRRLNAEIVRAAIKAAERQKR